MLTAFHAPFNIAFGTVNHHDLAGLLRLASKCRVNDTTLPTSIKVAESARDLGVIRNAHAVDGAPR